MNDLRDQIAALCIEGADAIATADAVLALPAIADLVAIREALIDAPHISYALKLAELCAPLTIEQVARALRYARHGLAQRDPINTDDEKALASWEDKR